MEGAVHSAEPLWVNGRPTSPREIKAGDEVEALGQNGFRRALVTKVRQGSGKGTVWLHGASGAAIRCLLDERVAVYADGRRRFRQAAKIRPGEFLCRVVSGAVTVDPVVAVRTLLENVPALYLELPAVSLVTEEGILCRPAS